LQTKQTIETMKMNGTVASLAFSSDSRTMYSFGGFCTLKPYPFSRPPDQGKVYVWDLNTRDCVHAFRDDGCLHGTAIATSNDDEYLACGFVCEAQAAPASFVW
jgi:hypothetical protein